MVSVGTESGLYSQTKIPQNELKKLPHPRCSLVVIDLVYIMDDKNELAGFVCISIKEEYAWM